MSQPFIPVPIDWNKHPLYRKMLRRDASYPDRFMSLVHLTACSREPGKLVVSDGTPLGVDEFAENHDRDWDAWSSFMAFGEEIGVFSKEGQMWIIAIWKLFSRDPVAEEKDRKRKKLEYYEGKTEQAKAELKQLRAEFDRMRKELEASQEPPDTTTDHQDSPDSPKVSESLHDSPPIDIDPDIDLEKDLDLQKDKRINTSACAEKSALGPKPPERSSGAPATWSAKLFKNACSSESLVETVSRDYTKLAEACDFKPRRLSGQQKVKLLQMLSQGKWLDYEDDPLVQLVALKMGINIAWTIGSEGYTNPESVWPMALKHAGLCLVGAKKIADLNRDAVELGESLIRPHEAEQYLPTSLELEEQCVAAGNSS